jgi:hypothetical protein
MPRNDLGVFVLALVARQETSHRLGFKGIDHQTNYRNGKQVGVMARGELTGKIAQCGKQVSKDAVHQAL